MEEERYAIDSSSSRFTVRAFASGMFSAFGHSPTLRIQEFTGEATFAPGTLDQAELHIQIKAGSLAVANDISAKDRQEIEHTMNRDVLEIAKYPDILFDSLKVSASKAGDGQYWVNLVGTLLLHGVSNSQPIAAQVALIGDTLRAHGEFSLSQATYGIKPVSIAGGSLKLKDELKCTFDIVARKEAKMVESTACV